MDCVPSGEGGTDNAGDDYEQEASMEASSSPDEVVAGEEDAIQVLEEVLQEEEGDHLDRDDDSLQGNPDEVERRPDTDQGVHREQVRNLTKKPPNLILVSYHI